MNIEELSYAAGLFDGEGTVTLTRNKANEQRSPTVSLSSTTYELVQFMKDTFGGRIVTLTRTKKQGHKQAWHWQTSYSKAIEVLIQIRPYLREPEKTRRADMIINDYRDVVSKNGKYSQELLDKRLAFETEFFINSTKA